MAFPAVAATNTYAGGATTSHPVNLPASISAGDLLVIFLTLTGSSITEPAGWSTLYNAAFNSSTNVEACFYKSASGSEGATVSVTTSNSKMAATAYRITGWSGTPESTTVATGSSTAPNSSSLTPSWGALDTLFISAAHVNALRTFSGFPTNYGTGQLSIATSSGSACSIGSAARQLNAASDDPGAFTIDSSSAWAARTVAVRPTASGTTGRLVRGGALTNGGNLVHGKLAA